MIKLIYYEFPTLPPPTVAGLSPHPTSLHCTLRPHFSILILVPNPIPNPSPGWRSKPDRTRAGLARSGERRCHLLWLSVDTQVTVSEGDGWHGWEPGAQSPLPTALGCETPLCFGTAHHQRPVSSLRGCSSFPGTDDKCHHRKLMVGLNLQGLFPPKGFHDSISPKTGVSLGTLSFSASQPGAPAHLSVVPARREGGKVGVGLERSPM